MSALFDLHTSEQPEFATTPNLTAMPSTNPQRFSATMAEAGAPDRFYNIQKAQAERYGKIIDDIHTMTGERLPNPATNDATMDEIRENWGQPYPMIFQKRLDKLRTKAREVRSSMPEGGYGTEPGYLDPDMVNTQIAAEGRATREAAAKLEDTGGAVGAMAGGFVGSFENPFNILATFIPATRAPAWLAEQSVGFFLRNVGKEALYQGATQAGAQAVSSAVEYGTRKPLGTEQTAGEIAGEIGGAAVFGAVIGGVARGAVPAWLKVRRMWGAGEYVPTAVKDAAITLEGKAIYGDKNPLGISASANESALDKAVQDVALNRPADVSGIVEIMETPGKTIAEGIMERVNNIRAARDLPPLPPEHFGIGKTGETTGAAGAAAVEAPLPPMSQWQIDNAAAAVDLAKKLGLTEDVRRLAEQGDLTAKQISERLGGRLSPEEVRAVRDSMGIAPIGPAQAFGVEIPGGEAKVAAEAEKAVADARLQGAAAAEAAPAPTAPLAQAAEPVVVPPATIADQMPYRALQRLANVFEEGNNQPIRLLDFNPEVVAALEQAGFARDGIMTARQFSEMIAARDARDTAVRQAADQARLQKMADDIEKAPPAQKPVAPTPEQPAGAVKPPGESPEDKAVLDQAKRMIESPEVAVPPEKRAAYSAAEKQEQEAKVAAGCLAGAI